MSDRDKYPSEAAERFQIRLPAGLRDRIKTYAERHGRSMNTEIVRILEREFPEPLSLEQRVDEMIDLLAIMKEGGLDDAADTLADHLETTVRAIASGRINLGKDGVREGIRERLREWTYEKAEIDQQEFEAGFDEEELQARSRGEDFFKG